MRKTYLGIGLLTAIVGLLMVFAPEAWLKVVVILLGTAAIVNGFFNIIYVRTIIDDELYRKAVLFRGIISIAIGLTVIILPLVIVATLWTIMLYVLAGYLLVSSGLEIYATIKLKSAGVEVKPYYGEIVGSIILAVILFIIPVQLGQILIQICGGVLIVTGIGIIVWEWKNRNYIVYPTSVSDDE